jgi:hypothetical protein
VEVDEGSAFAVSRSLPATHTISYHRVMTCSSVAVKEVWMMIVNQARYAAETCSPEHLFVEMMVVDGHVSVAVRLDNHGLVGSLGTSGFGLVFDCRWKESPTAER